MRLFERKLFAKEQDVFSAAVMCAVSKLLTKLENSLMLPLGLLLPRQS